MPHSHGKPKRAALVLVSVLLVGLIVGTIGGYAVTSSLFNGRLTDVQNQMYGELQTQLQNLPATNATYVSYPNNTYTYILNDNVSLSQVYREVQQSVVVIRGVTESRNFFQIVYSQVQGSGFVAQINGQIVVVTNNHVVSGTINNTVTFTDGSGYAARVLGTDPYADLAVLSIDGSPSELKPLVIVSSSTLEAGDPVIAVGSPYGLAGSVTPGIVSALGRTISEDLSGGVTIPGVIQTSTLINPGNSGGPLVNYAGEVVGITTAIVSNSQGLGFAIPSNTILREIESLATTGSYTKHPNIDAAGTDMTFEIAQAMKVNVTYGWLIQSSNIPELKGFTTRALVAGSNEYIGGDIVTAVNGVRIANSDDLLSYLDANTLPNQTVNLTVVRSGETLTVPIVLSQLS
jgi:S1-C subfamily serine protease